MEGIYNFGLVNLRVMVRNFILNVADNVFSVFRAVKQEFMQKKYFSIAL